MPIHAEGERGERIEKDCNHPARNTTVLRVFIKLASIVKYRAPAPASSSATEGRHLTLMPFRLLHYHPGG